MKKVLPGGYLPRLFKLINRFSSPSLFLFALIIMLLAACGQPENGKPAILKIFGNGAAGNFSKNYILYTTLCHMGQPGALMAEEGDMLWLENWIFINDPSIKGNDGAIHFIESDSVLLLNGKIAGIRVDSNYSLQHLVDLNSKTELGNLKILAVTPEGFAKNKQSLEKIASLNPGLILMLSGKFKDEDLQWLMGLFAPTTLSIELAERQQQILAGEKQLVHLFIANNDSIYHCTPLPALPKLQSLSFSFDGNEVAPSPENKNWLKSNPQIRNLILSDWEDGYPQGLLSALEAPEVLIMGGMQIPAAEISAHGKSLKRVILDSAELQMTLPSVETITLINSKDPQAILGQISLQKPGCKALEIFADHKPLDLSPVQSLKNLEALTLVDADRIPIAPLLQMKQLKLLSYSSDSTNMDSTISTLQSALPNAVVVANDGLCLGSGWLLALVPALLAALGLAVYRKKSRT